jgi:hypothetical protein
LTPKNSISFPLVYWVLFIIILVSISYSDGKKRIADYSFTEGIVIDKIFLPPPAGSRRYGGGGNRDVEYAQWQYTVDNETHLIVDKRSLSYNKSLGTRRTIIYLNEKHEEGIIYSFFFWVNTPLILIWVIIAFFIFAICQFAIHWNDNTWFQRQYRGLYK